MNTAIIQQIQSNTGIHQKSVDHTVTMLEEGLTVPFISRYRKERSGGLKDDEVQNIATQLQQLLELDSRKETILKAILKQEKLTPGLEKKIHSCWDATELEDLYLPFKKSKKSRAHKAREAGLEPLAELILDRELHNIPEEAKRFINDQVPGAEDAIEGAKDIVAERINEKASVRQYLRYVLTYSGILVAGVIKKKEKEAEKYETYFDFKRPLRNVQSHQLLAIMRAQKEGFLRVKIDIDEDRAMLELLKKHVKGGVGGARQLIFEAAKDALKRLLLPSIENEVLKQAKERADLEAIEVFEKNLKDLLLAPPLGNQWILGIDPGFKSGCKLVILNETGQLIDKATIFPHPPQEQKEDAAETILQLLDKYPIQAIAIGNGTAGKESYHWLKKALPEERKTGLFFVNENGASVYSASELARKEFPDEDVTVRGAISIGRRLMDPLSELIKIDPKSIGVGQYQHDVNQKLLKEKLDQTVEWCVHQVGVELNTASTHLLQQVSGLGAGLAQNIIDYREKNGHFSSRKELKKVDRLGDKAFEQAAGFLRIRQAEHPLDNTAVHPERYGLVKQIAQDAGLNVEQLIRNEEALKLIDWKRYIDEDTGEDTLKDIRLELSKPGRDPRGKAREITFEEELQDISDLEPGMVVKGIVNNITRFGAFVDIGIKENGLVHLSEITHRYVKDPSDELSIDQEVRVKVLDVDRERGRISLSMKDLK